MSRENSAVTRLQIFSFFVIASIVIDDAWAKPPKSLIGGTDASLGEIVYQVSLRRNGKHRCGGSLISTRHVLTAAHCVADLVAPYNDLIAVTGTVSLEKGGEETKIAHIDIHQNFTLDRRGTWLDDIAVITLVRDTEVNTYQWPIGLPDEETPENVTCIISGWGYKTYDDYPDGDFSTMLQKSDMTIMSNAKCQRAHRRNIINHKNICGFKNKFSGVCEGDGGSPLVYDGAVVGISSWYYPCALGLPDVYTRVYHYRRWILNIMARSFFEQASLNGTQKSLNPSL